MTIISTALACQKSGDVIDLAAQLLGLTNREAAKRLAVDFGIRSYTSSTKINSKIPYEHSRQFHKDEQECYLALLGYLKLLEQWEKKYSPTSQISTPDPRFVEACQMKSYVEYLCDIFIKGSTEERVIAICDLKPNLINIAITQQSATEDV